MKNGKINYSLQLLRLILSFWVVLHHSYSKIHKIINKGRFHVSIFMMMSFYFYYNTCKTKNIIKIKQRFQRILIPYIFWPTFTFIINNILFKYFRCSLYNKKLLLKDLIEQLIVGAGYHNLFYFLFILIILSILFTIISFLYNKSSIFIFQISLIAAYILQYSYWNLYIFSQYSDAIKYSLGEIVEFLPFAVAGFTLSYIDIKTKIIKFKELVIFFSIVIIFLILEFDIFVFIKGFWYPGILLNVGGICIFILFSSFSFQSRKIIILLKIITKFTGGIYYIHLICRNILRQIFFLVANRTFFGSICIYITSYIICFIGNKLSYKTKLQFLFN